MLGEVRGRGLWPTHPIQGDSWAGMEPPGPQLQVVWGLQAGARTWTPSHRVGPQAWLRPLPTPGGGRGNSIDPLKDAGLWDRVTGSLTYRHPRSPCLSISVVFVVENLRQYWQNCTAKLLQYSLNYKILSLEKALEIKYTNFTNEESKALRHSVPFALWYIPSCLPLIRPDIIIVYTQKPKLL